MVGQYLGSMVHEGHPPPSSGTPRLLSPLVDLTHLAGCMDGGPILGVHGAGRLDAVELQGTEDTRLRLMGEARESGE